MYLTCLGQNLQNEFVPVCISELTLNPPEGIVAGETPPPLVRCLIKSASSKINRKLWLDDDSHKRVGLVSMLVWTDSGHVSLEQNLS